MNQPLPVTVHTQPAGRSGRLALGLRRAPDGRSFIDRQHATYPFHICRPLYYGGDPNGMATLYLQSIAGGVFEHDRLAMALAVGPGAALHLTSQGATIVHAMTGGRARLASTVTAGAGAVAELLPEATILFPGADLETRTEVVADETAVVLVGESFIAHDPSGNGAPFGRLLTEVSFRTPDGRLLACDRQATSGAAFRALAAAGSRRFEAYAGIQLWAPRRDGTALLAACTGSAGVPDGVYFGASPLPHGCGIGMRILAADGASLKATIAILWRSLRRGLFEADPAPRRK
ncbi:MAG: urease accessory protein UreD [Alphaproteobacteria bacterium]